MKKVLSIALAVVVVLSLAVTAGATWPPLGNASVATVQGDVATPVNVGTTRNITIGFSGEANDPFPMLPTTTATVNAGWTNFTIQNVQTPTFAYNPTGFDTTTRPAQGRIDVGPRQPGTGGWEFQRQLTLVFTGISTLQWPGPGPTQGPGAASAVNPITNATFGVAVNPNAPSLTTIPTAFNLVSLAVAAPTGQVPNNWRVDGITTGGEIRIQHELNQIIEMTGDASVRVQLLPSDFEWRIPNSNIVSIGGALQTSNSGFETVTWEQLTNNLLPNFVVTNVNIPADVSTALRAIHMERAQIRTTRTTNMSGRIRDLGWHFTSGNLALRIRTVEYMTHTGTNNVEFDLNIAVTGNPNRNIGAVGIDVANTRLYVWNNDEFVQPGRTEYLHGGETVRNLEILAGHEVYFTRNLTSGQSIYVQASLATHDAFDELFQQHAELVDVIQIHHTGMNAAGVTARINRANTYFVYNADRVLIGTTADNNLPFSTLYFLTTAQINLGGGPTTPTEPPAPVTPTVPVDPSIPPAGGDGTGGQTNVNFNPGTGR